MFGRRKPRSWMEKTLSWIWPRRGVGPAFRYLQKRLVRIKGSPHAIAVGFASGAAVSFLPLPGLHFVLGAICAVILRGSIIASAVGTAIGNPWTFPFIWLGGYRLGRWLGVGDDGAFGQHSIGAAARRIKEDLLAGRVGEAAARGWEVLGPTFVGGAIIGLAVGVLCYLGMRMALSAYQKRRRARIAASRARWRQAAAGVAVSPGE